MLGLAKSATTNAPSGSAGQELDDVALRVKLTQELETAQGLLEKSDGVAWAPVGVGDDELLILNRKLQQWVHSLELQIKALDGLASSVESLGKVESIGAAEIARSGQLDLVTPMFNYHDLG